MASSFHNGTFLQRKKVGNGETHNRQLKREGAWKPRDTVEWIVLVRLLHGDEGLAKIGLNALDYCKRRAGIGEQKGRFARERKLPYKSFISKGLYTGMRRKAGSMAGEIAMRAGDGRQSRATSKVYPGKVSNRKLTVASLRST